MELRKQFFVILLIFVKEILSAPPDWKCGTTGTEDLSYNVVQFECPMARPGIGLCCQIHDDCYDNQRGREKCDAAFCACMTSTMNVSNCKGPTVQNFCTLVKFNGGLAYSLAGLKKNG